MREMSLGPIRRNGWAVPFLPAFPSRLLSRLRFPGSPLRLALLVCLAMALCGASSAGGQHAEHNHTGSSVEHVHGQADGAVAWEGSAEGIAYSEFNHHLAGLFLLLVGFSEAREAIGWSALVWTRFLLPGALMLGGCFLLIWSDHDAWPIGSLSFVQTFFGHDPEILQHKTYGILALGIGAIEWCRRLGLVTRSTWAVPLPLFAIVGGLMLFLHSHGDHPSAHKIAVDHAIMGTLAITAGALKLLSGWGGARLLIGRFYWDLAWAGLVLVIGLQLLVYSE
ncbi:hypothetical protein FBQ96_05360 [Nitrospirales bacterium NOB]|nr:MAG: hypothetical protein UZ03_NOB001002044 [Nitrospira sp. OLB3]MBV6470004.1 hypothetical protein [Nitrospirota bacterium]MCE7964589.1 hypothetical protein [Nitrospira sp. NTP2]MDL1888998.1 hypothetical protein [Nitrospirales bacterium NOB]MEB2338315.1 hypothetical protein [Nitrospirales bacterium]QOJ35117.1 MAG: hypothetical protein HRU82_09200 [Nitrospira sp.]